MGAPISTSPSVDTRLSYYSVITVQRLCVYCGSSDARDDLHREAAVDLGRALVEHGLELVYGGASVGLMGVIADSVLERGGSVIGVIPKSISEMEVAHDGLTELRVVADMHERKAMMMELSDGFIAMPGGLGTLEELFEALTWLQLRFHLKPVGLLNSAGYFDSLINFLQQGVAAGFVKQAHLEELLVAQDSASLIDKMRHFSPQGLDKLSKSK